jgi:hypothetical protein
MGLGMPFLEYLSDRKLIAAGGWIYDIGSQNLYGATPEAIRRFAMRHGHIEDDDVLRKESERISYFSTPRPGERTAYVSELIALTDIHYESIDICPALKSDDLDLNVERLPDHQRGQSDVVLNFGTTEHIVNQLNAFELMHDAMKVGGVTFHQVPSIGYIDHGYVNYNPLLLEDLAKANRYEIVDKFFTRSGQSEFGSAGIDLRDPYRPTVPYSDKEAVSPAIPNVNLNFVVRKTVQAPFYVGLEIATSHSGLSRRIAKIYGPDRRLAVGDEVRRRAASDREARSDRPVSSAALPERTALLVRRLLWRSRLLGGGAK